MIALLCDDTNLINLHLIWAQASFAMSQDDTHTMPCNTGCDVGHWCVCYAGVCIMCIYFVSLPVVKVLCLTVWLLQVVRTHPGLGIHLHSWQQWSCRWSSCSPPSCTSLQTNWNLASKHDLTHQPKHCTQNSSHLSTGMSPVRTYKIYYLQIV